MITGDKKETAMAVAKEVGLIGHESGVLKPSHSPRSSYLPQSPDISRFGSSNNLNSVNSGFNSDNSEEELVLTSDQLRQMDDAHIQLILPKLRIVARAVPTDKSRLVRIAQSAGHVVGNGFLPYLEIYIFI